MHLERIEISGFKSFADRTVIEFDKGVTAVVGPNGSGKSNLSEAIKWVLGEQSAKSLRGKKMDDIIFAGSQTRKATNIAEVTLVLNNEDHFLPLEFAEIQITRRINRQGDSECFINKKPCRLKDIVNLFMDSGLGKDSFSIISQGKVETIFHNKPEDRRGMFEEVAGVLKYKTRKQEASRKLDRTQENLDRVEDILFEIDKQLLPLQRQKEKALLYQEKRTALSSIDIALMVAEIDTMSQQMSITQNELASLQQELAQTKTTSQNNDMALAQHKIQLNQVDNAVAQLQEKYVETVRHLEQTTGEYNLAKERLSFSTQTKGQQEFAQFEKEQEKNRLEKAIEQIEQQQAERQKELATLTAQVNDLNHQKTLLDAHSQELVEEQRQLYIDALQQQARYQNDVQTAEKEIQHANSQMMRIQQREDDCNRQIVVVSAEKAKLEKRLDESKAEIERLNHDYQESQSQLVSHQQAFKQLEQDVQLNAQKLAQLSARKQSLQDLDEDFAGYYQGVRAVLKAQSQLKGVHGSLAQMIDVPKAYTVAIDIALGASLQHVIVDDENSAKQAIEFLKRQKLGRATFLPIQVIAARQLSSDVLQKVKQVDGFIGVASELVQSKPVYKNIVANQLGQTIISKNLDAGNQMAKVIGYRHRVVTLDGDVIHAGGSMTGGATQQKGQSLLSRSSTLAELKQQIAQLKDKQNEAKQQLSQYQLLVDEWTKKVSSIQQSGTQSRLLERESDVSLQRAIAQLAQLNEQYKLVQIEKTALYDELNESKAALDNAQHLLTHSQKTVKQTQDDLSKLNVSQEEKAEQLALLVPRLNDATMQLAVEKEKEQADNEQKSQLNKQLQQVMHSLDALMSQYSQENQTAEQLQELIEKTAEDMERLTQSKTQLDQQLSDNRIEKSRLDALVVELEETQRQLQKALEGTLKQEGVVQARLERYDVSIDTHLNRLSQEYNLTYEAAKEEKALEMSITDAVSYVARLKREIEQIGPVNMTAIEEYDQVFERFTTMSQQQADLQQAKEQLLSTMLEMDNEVAHRFKETFFAIKSKFEQTFPKLFGGGRATLELTQPDNLLESGIDIIAQPPGKRLQNLSLLSGGEKAFTAIALLFAILEVKPVPFCLLDEVEAALDEANVGRYGRYLKTFIDQTQFIVITHRKGTMEEADVLYGVTMQESGVSKLASVKFEDYTID
ncbi:chromosome segregation protein SMC [Carnobacteriaceae bacterium zg-ZUI240]|nr:chromosome segregation protein SMC [Carnobacteriaceae bacterium zg-ZUI240]